MDWTSLVWFGVGVGIGILVGQRTHLSRLVRQSQPQTSAGADLEIQALRSQLEQMHLAYHLATEMSQLKGGFLARTSHELRSPLSGVVGLHQLILNDLADSPEEEREFVQQSYESSLKMVKLLDEILDLAKTEHGTAQLDLQPVNLANLIHDVYRLTHLQASNRNLRLVLPTVDPIWHLYADPRRIRQVFVNLVDVAIMNLSEGVVQLFMEMPPDRRYVSLWVEDPDLIRITHEPIDWLPQDPIQMPSTATPATKPQLLENACAPFPSAGLTLLVNRSLVQQMQGRLELLPGKTSTSPMRICCTMPLITLEEGLV